MKKRLLILAAIFLAAFIEVQAQGFGLWSNVAVDKHWIDGLSTSFSAGYRSGKNLQYSDRWDASLGIKYNVCDYFKIGTNYVFMQSYSPEEIKNNYKDDIIDEYHWRGYNKTLSHWRNKHRWTADLTGEVKVSRFSLSLRERYQFTHYCQTDNNVKQKYRFPNPAIKEDAELKETEALNAKNAHTLRSRLSIEYDIRRCPVKPFLSYEFHNNLTEKLHLEKSRLCIGIDWKITKMHRLSLAYVFENKADDENNGDLHVLDLGYKIKF